MHIDWWTLALETINVLILVWLLSRFLYRPVHALVDRRRAETSRLLNDAETARNEAHAIRASAEAFRDGILADRERLVMESHKSAQAQADAELAQVAERAAKLHAAAAADIARERAAAEADLIDHARELAIEICRRLLARLPSSVTLAAFVEGLCAEIRNLPPQMRPADDDELEVKTAAPVTSEAAENMRGALAAAFGRAHLLTLRADPAVIAGIELRTPHALMCNSWRADLKRISEELKHDRDQPGDTRGLARTG